MLVARALEWLKTPSQPFFTLGALFTRTNPYEPPEPYPRATANLPMTGKSPTSMPLPQLAGALRTQPIYDALIAVMADHGEALGEHANAAMAIFLYDDTFTCLLLFKFARRAPWRQRVQLAQASSISLPPYFMPPDYNSRGRPRPVPFISDEARPPSEALSGSAATRARPIDLRMPRPTNLAAPLAELLASLRAGKYFSSALPNASFTIT